jgi:hypothetical protein
MKPRRFRLANYCLIAFVLLLYGNSAHAQAAPVSESQARDLARGPIQTATERGEEGYSVHRREDLEDSLCRFIMLGASKDPNPSCAFVFQLSDESYAFKKGKVNYRFSVHGPFVYYVVVSRNSGDVFRIQGLKESRDEFNRMAKAFSIHVTDDSDALRYAELYRALEPTNLMLELPNTNLELKQLAEKRFYDSFYPDFNRAESRFDEWWKIERAGLLRQTLGPIATKTSSGYVVTFMTMSDIDKRHPEGGPGLLKASVEISTDGQVTGPTLAPVSTN